MLNNIASLVTVNEASGVFAVNKQLTHPVSSLIAKTYDEHAKTTILLEYPNKSIRHARR